jgi:hypothetical protein
MNPVESDADIPSNLDEQKMAAFCAAECAERAISCFEKCHPDDDRPRKAIEAARAWGRGEMGVSEARAAAFAAHAAARSSNNPSARAAARAAGHAAAAAHVSGHARHAEAYALKAASLAEGAANPRE